LSTLKAKPKQPGSTPLATGHCPLATNPKRVISPASGALPAPGEGSFPPARDGTHGKYGGTPFLDSVVTSLGRQAYPCHPTVDRILEMVCMLHGVPLSEVMAGNKNRVGAVTRCRSDCVIALKRLRAFMSTTDIAKAVGFRSHTQIVNILARSFATGAITVFTAENAEARGGNHV